MPGRVYERELKGILHGDFDALTKACNSCNAEERESLMKIKEKPFAVIRGAGSLGFDLMAMRGDVSFPIEVKASKSKTLRFSKSTRIREQADYIAKECDKAGLVPIYAYRLKSYRGDSWRIFTLEVKKPQGVLGLIYDRIPKAEKTKQGYLIMRWQEGMPLHKLIDYLCSD